METDPNTAKLCLLCGVASSELVPNYFQRPKLQMKIFRATGLNIVYDPCYPNAICTECTGTIGYQEEFARTIKRNLHAWRVKYYGPGAGPGPDYESAAISIDGTLSAASAGTTPPSPPTSPPTCPPPSTVELSLPPQNEPVADVVGGGHVDGVGVDGGVDADQSLLQPMFSSLKASAGTFECATCNKTFKLGHMIRHQRVHNKTNAMSVANSYGSSIASDSSAITTSAPREDVGTTTTGEDDTATQTASTYRCTLDSCDQEFPTLRKRTNHERKAHRPMLECDACNDAKFAIQYELEWHWCQCTARIQKAEKQKQQQLERSKSEGGAMSTTSEVERQSRRTRFSRRQSVSQITLRSQPHDPVRFSQRLSQRTMSASGLSARTMSVDSDSADVRLTNEPADSDEPEEIDWTNVRHVSQKYGTTESQTPGVAASTSMVKTRACSITSRSTSVDSRASSDISVYSAGDLMLTQSQKKDRRSFQKSRKRSRLEATEVLFQCESVAICDYGDPVLRETMEHERVVHANMMLFNCEECKEWFSTRKYLQLHQSKHPKVSYYCSLCCTEFETMYHLQQHLLLHQYSSPSFDCKKCRHSFVKFLDLEQHDQKHIAGTVKYDPWPSSKTQILACNGRSNYMPPPPPPPPVETVHQRNIIMEQPSSSRRRLAREPIKLPLIASRQGPRRPKGVLTEEQAKDYEEACAKYRFSGCRKLGLNRSGDYYTFRPEPHYPQRKAVLPLIEVPTTNVPSQLELCTVRSADAPTIKRPKVYTARTTIAPPVKQLEQQYTATRTSAAPTIKHEAKLLVNTIAEDIVDADDATAAKRAAPPQMAMDNNGLESIASRRSSETNSWTTLSSTAVGEDETTADHLPDKPPGNADWRNVNRADNRQMLGLPRQVIGIEVDESLPSYGSLMCSSSSSSSKGSTESISADGPMDLSADRSPRSLLRKMVAPDPSQPFRFWVAPNEDVRRPSKRATTRRRIFDKITNVKMP